MDVGDLEKHVRQRVAGYKVPRSVWLVDGIARTISGKADYRWAHRYAEEHAAAGHHTTEHHTEGVTGRAD